MEEQRAKNSQDTVKCYSTGWGEESGSKHGTKIYLLDWCKSNGGFCNYF